MAAVIPSTAPPAYEPGSSPPSYDDLVDKVSQMVGSDPTPQKLIDAAAQLADHEIQILMDGGDFSDPIKNEEDNKVFCAGAAKGLASPECVKHLKEASNAAVNADNEIRQIFVSLRLKIAQIDRIHRSDFEPALQRHEQAYREVLANSRDLASRIAVHGDRFDELILPFCLREDLTVDDRRGVLNDFINQMGRAHDDARTMEGKFHNLQTNLTSFIAEFSVWAKDREDELTREIALVLEELDQLGKKLASLNASMLALGGGAFLLPVIGGFVTLAGSLGPFAVIAGLFALGLGFAALVSWTALSIAKSVTESQIRIKEGEKASLEDQVEQIRLARLELMEMGENKLEAFRVNINVLELVWASVSADTLMISEYLNGALSIVQFPEWMQPDLNRANSIYKTMSEYLTNYAKGIPS